MKPMRRSVRRHRRLSPVGTVAPPRSWRRTVWGRRERRSGRPGGLGRRDRGGRRGVAGVAVVGLLVAGARRRSPRRGVVVPVMPVAVMPAAVVVAAASLPVDADAVDVDPGRAWPRRSRALASTGTRCCRADGYWRRRVERSRIASTGTRPPLAPASPSPVRRDALDPLFVGERCNACPEQLVAALERSPRSIARPMLAPSFSTSTCIATIPASITPSNGIHARPLTIRSSSEWSGRPQRTTRERASGDRVAAVPAGAGRDPDVRRGRGTGRAGSVALRPSGGPETRRGAAGAGWRRSARRRLPRRWRLGGRRASSQGASWRRDLQLAGSAEVR